MNERRGEFIAQNGQQTCTSRIKKDEEISIAQQQNQKRKTNNVIHHCAFYQTTNSFNLTLVR
jgi:hypothetical protein